MENRPLRPKSVEEDLRFTEYRLQVMRGLPVGPLRDAVLGGITARLAALTREFQEGPTAFG
jgi:hypothetical protein